LIVRVLCCITGAAVAGVGGVVVEGVVVDGVVVDGVVVDGVVGVVAGVSDFTNSVSALSGMVAGACPLAITAVSKLNAITVNEATRETGDLEPSIWRLSFTSAWRNINGLRIKCDTRANSRGKVPLIIKIVSWRKRVTSA
jgi:hypothetical protein